MLKHLILWLLVSGLGLGGLTIRAEEKTNPEEKAKATDEKKKEMDDDLDDLNEALKPEPVPEETDVLAVLKQISEKMTDSADGLSKASIWKAIKEGEDAGKKIEEIIRMQKEALAQLDKSLQETKSKQKGAIDDITKLIKLARKMQSNSQSDGSAQQSNPEPKPGQKNPGSQQKPNQGPAQQPYESTTNPPGSGRHTGGASEQWGNLPPKLRDAILLSKNEEFTLEYQEWLQRYFKILAGEQK